MYVLYHLYHCRRMLGTLRQLLSLYLETAALIKEGTYLY